MELEISVNGERFRIPMEIPENYNPQWVVEYEESGWDYAQSQFGLDA